MLYPSRRRYDPKSSRSDLQGEQAKAEGGVRFRRFEADEETSSQMLQLPWIIAHAGSATLPITSYIRQPRNLCDLIFIKFPEQL